jgi:hypothetical protein
MSDPIRVRTLTDGGQSADEIATDVIGFVDAARESLDLALYDEVHGRYPDVAPPAFAESAPSSH